MDKESGVAKRQITIYLAGEDRDRLNALLAYYLLRNKKQTQSDLFCTALKMLYDDKLVCYEKDGVR